MKEYFEESAIFYNGMYYKPARLDARIGDLILLNAPFEGKRIHTVERYSGLYDMTPLITYKSKSHAVDVSDYVLLIPIGTGRR